MTATRPYGAPSWEQELLLQAALLRGPAAAAAQEQWRLHVDPAALDYNSQRLLPLLYRALLARGVTVPEMGRLKGVYRRTWYENTVRLHAAARLLKAFHAAGIETMLLKGAALTLRYYGDYGLRPMEDLDILIPTHQAATAIDLLKRMGLTAVFESVGFSEATALTIGHAYPFRDAGGHEVDLHWHVFYQRVDPQADAEFWTAARPIVLHGVATRTLSAADQLLHVCVHGTQMPAWGYEREPNARWVADAAVILTNAMDEHGWERLFSQARRLQFVLPLREALEYLRAAVDAPIPAETMRRMRGMRASLGERVADRARTRPPAQWGPWLALAMRYLEYCSNLPAGVGLLRRLAGLPGFFQDRWGHISLWRLPFAAGFRGLRRVLWTVGGQRRPNAGT